jgi:uncharacterized membrane protein SpoIIM required for sporulation
MEFADALQAVVDGYRSRAEELLPTYFLSPAAAQVARVVVFAGLAAAYAYLATTGRLAQFRADLRVAGVEPPAQDADVEAYEAWFDAVQPAFERLLTPELLAILLGSVLVSVAVWVVLNAVVTAGQLGCSWAVMRDRRGTTAAFGAARRHWRPVLGLFVLQVAIAVLVSAVVVVPVLVVALVAPLAAVVVGLGLLLVWLVAVVVLRVVFAFAAVAVVVEDVGVAGGLSGSLRFVRRHLAAVLGYLVAVLGVYTLVGTAAAVGGGAGNAAASGLIGLVVAAPTLDLLKVALYGDAVGSISPPQTPDRTVLEQLRAGLVGGIDETRTFVARRPGLHALAAVVLVAGAVGGWVLAGPWEGLVTASIEARLADHAPQTAVVSFTTNNIGVAVSTAVSGLAYGVPAGVSLLFNGAVLGVLGRLETAPVAFAAFVLPHGLVELPAFVIAGALGFSLGADAWRARRGTIDRAALADALERGFRILVGIAVLLAVAGLVEGVFSPYYFRPFVAW